MIKEEVPAATRMTIWTVGGRAAGKSRVVSWADALDEEQQAREMDDDDWQLR